MADSRATLSYNLYDAQVLDPVMHSESENLGKGNSKGGPMGSVGPQDGVCVRCWREISKSEMSDRQTSSPA
jgi:hypothetical protein